VRRIGVRVEQLEPSGGSAVALWDPDEEWRDAERAIDTVSARFGPDAITPAALVNAARTTVGETSSLRVLADRERAGRSPE
jgi:DNA polymerase IV